MGFHATQEHGLDSHSHLFVVLRSHPFTRLYQSIRMLVLRTITAFGTHILLPVRTSGRAGQWFPNAATTDVISRPVRQETAAVQEYLSPSVAYPACLQVSLGRGEDGTGRASLSFFDRGMLVHLLA